MRWFWVMGDDGDDGNDDDDDDGGVGAGKGRERRKTGDGVAPRQHTAYCV